MKSKKSVKKPGDEKPITKPINKPEKEISKDRKGKGGPVSQLSQQHIANIPSLMATPVPPPVMPQGSSNKNQFGGPRIHKLPPRLAKQRENRLQKQHMHHNICDVNDMNKVNQNMNVYNMKDGQNSVTVPHSNAWEKPLTVQRGSMDQESMLGVGIDACKSIDQAQSPNQGHTSPNADKVS